MVEKRNKIKMLLYGSMFVAIGLGVYAQDIAYFLRNNLATPPLAGVSIITTFSILLFLIPPILVSNASKQNKIRKKEFKIYLSINALIGIVISTFSLIVLAAWWG